MEWIDGVKIDDSEGMEYLLFESKEIGMKKLGLNKNEVAKTLAYVFSEQIFIHGFVHADPRMLLYT